MPTCANCIELDPLGAGYTMGQPIAPTQYNLPSSSRAMTQPEGDQGLSYGVKVGIVVAGVAVSGLLAWTIANRRKPRRRR